MPGPESKNAVVATTKKIVSAVGNAIKGTASKITSTGNNIISGAKSLGADLLSGELIFKANKTKIETIKRLASIKIIVSDFFEEKLSQKIDLKRDELQNIEIAIKKHKELPPKTPWMCDNEEFEQGKQLILKVADQTTKIAIGNLIFEDSEVFFDSDLDCKKIAQIVENTKKIKKCINEAAKKHKKSQQAKRRVLGVIIVIIAAGLICLLIGILLILWSKNQTGSWIINAGGVVCLALGIFIIIAVAVAMLFERPRAALNYAKQARRDDAILSSIEFTAEFMDIVIEWGKKIVEKTLLTTSLEKEIDKLEKDQQSLRAVSMQPKAYLQNQSFNSKKNTEDMFVSNSQMANRVMLISESRHMFCNDDCIRQYHWNPKSGSSFITIRDFDGTDSNKICKATGYFPSNNVGHSGNMLNPLKAWVGSIYSDIVNILSQDLSLGKISQNIRSIICDIIILSTDFVIVIDDSKEVSKSKNNCFSIILNRRQIDAFRAPIRDLCDVIRKKDESQESKQQIWDKFIEISNLIANTDEINFDNDDFMHNQSSEHYTESMNDSINDSEDDEEDEEFSKHGEKNSENDQSSKVSSKIVILNTVATSQKSTLSA